MTRSSSSSTLTDSLPSAFVSTGCTKAANAIPVTDAITSGPSPQGTIP
jgi:hypothetical protein